MTVKALSSFEFLSRGWAKGMTVIPDNIPTNMNKISVCGCSIFTPLKIVFNDFPFQLSYFSTTVAPLRPLITF